MSENYYCMYWNAGEDVMRGYYEDLAPHMARLDEEGESFVIAPFDGTVDHLKLIDAFDVE